MKGAFIDEYDLAEIVAPIAGSRLEIRRIVDCVAKNVCFGGGKDIVVVLCHRLVRRKTTPHPVFQDGPIKSVQGGKPMLIYQCPLDQTKERHAAYDLPTTNPETVFRYLHDR